MKQLDTNSIMHKLKLVQDLRNKRYYSVANISSWLYLGAGGLKCDREQAYLYTEEEAEALVKSYPEKEQKCIDTINMEDYLYQELERYLING